MNRRLFLARVGGAAAGLLVAGQASSAQEHTECKKKMKIVVLTGSPRVNGNSNYMAERFIAGAEEAGHSVYRFDCARHKVAGCLACNACGMNGPCVQKDDFELVRPRLIEADVIVLATPMYYFGFSAQLKTVIDRCYAINGIINGAPKKIALLMAYADRNRTKEETLLMHYRTLAQYMGWQDVGAVVAPGVWTAGAIKGTSYPEEAYRLGKSL